ncbi:helix-turn-helix domain-containing protein [Paenibacillus sp. MBLB4367]|uniref:helix-turn-helix domain-containing protein n=1 Tax=Paenibacillus sp. MBLB4367 TaxID=3384767 RepID=UPI0039081285
MLPWMKQASFKRKLFAYMFLLSIVPLLVLGTFSTFSTAKIVQEEVDHNHQIILRQFQYQINDFLKKLESASLQLASNIVIEKSVEIGPVTTDLGQTFAAIDTVQKLRTYSDINLDISLIYNKFKKVYSTREGYINQSDFAYNELVKRTGYKYNAAAVIPPNQDQGLNELLIVRPVPTFSVESPDGVLVIHVQTERLIELFNQAQLGEERKLLVIDDKGTIVMSQDKRELGSKLTTSSELYRFWQNPESFTDEFTLDGVSYNLTSQKSALNNWTYIAMTPTKELSRKSDNIKYVTWSLVGLLTLLWVLFSLIGSSQLYNPIQRLLQKFAGDRKPGQSFRDGLEELDSIIQHMAKANDHLRTELSERMPYWKESFVQQLLRGEMNDADFRGKMEQYGVPLRGASFYVCLVDVDEYGVFKQHYQENDRSLMLYALRKMVEEIAEESFSCLTAAPLPGQVVVIVGVEKTNEQSDQALSALANEFRAKVRHYFQFTVTVAVSNGQKGYNGIGEAYQEGLELLGYRLLMGHDVTISRNAIEPSIRQSSSSLLRGQKQIVTALAKGDLAEANNQLEQMIQVVPHYVHNSETVLGLFAYLLGELDYLLQEWGKEPREWFDRDTYKQLYGMKSLNEVKEWLEQTVFPAVVQALQDANVPKNKKLVQQALFYIHEHFESDLSLQQVADTIRVSTSQLSRIFKEETGFAFGDYLIDYRMDKAKEWLAHTEMPIKDIAERLRYTTVQNFTRIFKQVTDMPPGQYRKQFRHHED